MDHKFLIVDVPRTTWEKQRMPWFIHILRSSFASFLNMWHFLRSSCASPAQASMKTFKQTWMWPSGGAWEWFLAFSCTIYGFSTCNPIRLRPIATCNMVIWFDFLTGCHKKAAASCTHARMHTHSRTHVNVHIYLCINVCILWMVMNKCYWNTASLEPAKSLNRSSGP